MGGSRHRLTSAMPDMPYVGSTTSGPVSRPAGRRERYQALFEHRGARITGRVLTRMLQALLDAGLEVEPTFLNAARLLDKFYIPARYPNGLMEGAPTEFYTREEAEHALRYGRVLWQRTGFCRSFSPA